VRFVDTNVLLYAVSRSPDERPKAAAALALLEADDLVLSVQVLQEFYVQVTRASRPDRLSHDQAVLLIESFRLRFPVQDITVPLLHAALATAARFRISYWDAAIVERRVFVPVPRSCPKIWPTTRTLPESGCTTLRAPRRGRAARQS
jgi:predicted nucleic acid-binding protein